MKRVSKALLICLAIVFLSQHHDTASITKYDQSQHGTYNVQIHLKNLEVIAILDESMFSGGGEQSDIYDYEYTDVSDAFPNATVQTSSSESPLNTTSSSPTATPTLSISTTASLASTPSPSANKTNNRLTTILNSKVTVRPVTSKTNTTVGGAKPGASQGNNSNKYNTTNSVNVVLPSSSTSSATKAPPHNKVSENDQQQQQQLKLSTTTQPSQPSSSTATTPFSEGIDYTLMDTLSVPVEIQQAPSSHLPPMVIRKCAPGYFRDSNGKCRRIRKPHLPLIYRFLQMVHTPGVIKSFQGVESSTKKMNPELNAHPKTSKEEKLVLDLAAKLAKDDPSKVTVKQ
ncbi:hypothetical protein WDU94_003025 [Cyamophila willieti]